MIVECPGCKSRYDLSGRAPHTKARCRCGTVFELPKPPSLATLDCPFCGGANTPTSHDCTFCKRPLKVKACPRCFTRVFVGYKNCSNCGANVTHPAQALKNGQAQTRKCPACPDEFLETYLIEDHSVDQCPGCKGVYLDVTTLERVVEDRRSLRAESVLGKYVQESSRPPDSQSSKRPMYLRCPDCEVVMNRRLFATGSGIVIDVCRHHGTWFDAGELPEMVEFVSKGGLEQAVKRDLERQRAEIRSAAERQRFSAAMARPMSSQQKKKEISSNVIVSVANWLFRL